MINNIIATTAITITTFLKQLVLLLTTIADSHYLGCFSATVFLNNLLKIFSYLQINASNIVTIREVCPVKHAILEHNNVGFMHENGWISGWLDGWMDRWMDFYWASSELVSAPTGKHT